MVRYIFDVECDNFLEGVTRLHCLVMADIDTGHVYEYVNATAEQGLARLYEADLIVGHNAIKFDLPVLEKLYGWKPSPVTVVRDTLVLTRLIYTDLDTSDGALHKMGKLPGALYGSNKLEAWGYRLGHPKIGLDIEEWGMWTENMQARCVNDVVLTRKLYLQLPKYSARCIQLEHEVATLCAQMERNGFAFDKDKAVELYATLSKRRADLEASLRGLFPCWYAAAGEFTPKKDNAKLNYTGGVTFTKVKLLEFNPASRPMIADRLKAKYAWKPKEFTQSGAPQIDDGILKALPYPEAQALAEYFLIDKRIGAVAEGNQAWLKLAKDGRIHGSINTNGAVTGRATHSHPNISQVPKVGSPYGKECRALFTAPPGWVLVGSDLSGIELRALAHCQSAFDGGALVKEVLDGDPHTKLQKLLDLPSRDNAKTFRYAYLYGAGDVKLGTIVDPTAGEKKARQIGKAKRAKLISGDQGLAGLQARISKLLEKNGFLRGLDGRRLHVRSEHAALNTLLQSFGAVVAKQWIVNIDNMLRRAPCSLVHGWHGDYAFCAWSHDEVQIACKPEHADKIGYVCKQAALDAGYMFDLKIPIAAEAKIGNNWAETH
jgi:DNA polymerase-1